jgi:hypothetical protein
MDPKDPTINRILEEGLREIYHDRLQKVEVQSIMGYPMKENRYIVIYNLNVADSYPIIRAKIVVDTMQEELLPYDPGLL